MPPRPALEEHSGGPLELQVVVVDNASRDGTVDAVERAQDPGCEIVPLSGTRASPAATTGSAGRAAATDVHRLGRARSGPERSDHVLVLDADSANRARRAAARLPGRRPSSTGGTLRSCCRSSAARRSGASSRRPTSAGTDGRRAQHRAAGSSTCRRVPGVPRPAQDAAGEIDRRMWFGPDDADWCFAIRRAGFTSSTSPRRRSSTTTAAGRRLTHLGWPCGISRRSPTSSGRGGPAAAQPDRRRSGHGPRRRTGARGQNVKWMELLTCGRPCRRATAT